MFLDKRIKVAVCALLWVVTCSAYSAQDDYFPRYLIFTSDPQYPWTESSDHGWEESTSEKERRSQWLIETQYSDVANFRRNFSPVAAAIPVMINGDMTAFGHGNQRSTVNALLEKKLGKDYDYGLGNHDYENNVNDCQFPENNCAAGSILDLKERYWGKVASFDLAAREEGGSKVFYGSLAYSRVMGDIHLTQLNNEPTYSVSFSSGFPLNRVRYEITDALDWLERDLQRARSAGRIIILNMHKPDRWKGSDQQIARFKAMIERYNVTAVFAGHLHNDPGRYFGWNREDYFGDVPVFLSGGASNQTYLIVDVAPDRQSLKVHQVNGNNWPSRKEIAIIPVR